MNTSSVRLSLSEEFTRDVQPSTVVHTTHSHWNCCTYHSTSPCSQNCTCNCYSHTCHCHCTLGPEWNEVRNIYMCTYVWMLYVYGVLYHDHYNYVLITWECSECVSCTQTHSRWPDTDLVRWGALASRSTVAWSTLALSTAAVAGHWSRTLLAIHSQPAQNRTLQDSSATGHQSSLHP